MSSKIEGRDLGEEAAARREWRRDAMKHGAVRCSTLERDYFLGFLEPYLERLCARPSTPEVSSVPRRM